MKKPVAFVKVALALAVFAPAALLPVPSRAALLSSPPPSAAEAARLLQRAATVNLAESGLSRQRAEAILEGLTPAEIRAIAFAGPRWRAGGESEGITDSLMSNETAAIVLTILMLAVVIGAVEISRH
jgi:hypothetical protein